MGFGELPLTVDHARSHEPTLGCPYMAVGMHRAVDSAIGLPRSSTSASRMLAFCRSSQAAINEGLRRVARRGVDVVHVANCGSAETGHLYGALGFEHCATQTAWRKVVASVKP